MAFLIVQRFGVQDSNVSILPSGKTSRVGVLALQKVWWLCWLRPCGREMASHHQLIFSPNQHAEKRWKPVFTSLNNPPKHDKLTKELSCTSLKNICLLLINNNFTPLFWKASFLLLITWLHFHKTLTLVRRKTQQNRAIGSVHRNQLPNILAHNSSRLIMNTES